MIHYNCTIVIGFRYLRLRLYFGRSGAEIGSPLAEAFGSTIEVWEHIGEYDTNPGNEGSRSG